MTHITIKVESNGEFEDSVRIAIHRFLGRYNSSAVGHDVSELTRSVLRALMPGKHLFEKHEDHYCPERTCMICDGGLSHCVICGGAEASLTTVCPGYRIDPLRINGILNLTLDYRYGWVTCVPVLFHSSLLAVPLVDGAPKMEGYEIVFCPGHERSEWVAEKLPERKPPIVVELGRVLAEQDAALNGVN